MARTAQAEALTELHRQVQLRLRAATLRDLLAIWPTVDPENLRETLAPFLSAGLVVVRAGERASAAAAQRYYVEFRRAEGARRQIVVTLPEAPTPELVESGLRGAAISGIMSGRRRGLDPQASADNAFVKLSGSATGLVMGGARRLLKAAVDGDPEAKGYQRVTDGSPCAFCRMLASRGAVFKSESVQFKAHGHCGCTMEPVFEGSRTLPANERFRQEWEAATEGLSGQEALNAYRASLSQ